MDMVHRRAVEQDRGHFLTSGALLDDQARAFLNDLGISEFGDEHNWLDALTHGSHGSQRDYQRLEFLGDRVLGLTIAEWLFETGNQSEGKLSQRLNALVSRSMCADIARSIGLGQHIRLGKQARDDGGAESDNILGDVMEALLGALFVTHGFTECRKLVRMIWADAVEGQVGTAKHPKSALQEWAAGNQRKVPEYRLVERSGPDHAARFTVAVSIKGVGEVQATGTSKQEAEKEAARLFMERFG